MTRQLGYPLLDRAAVGWCIAYAAHAAHASRIAYVAHSLAAPGPLAVNPHPLSRSRAMNSKGPQADPEKCLGSISIFTAWQSTDR